MRRICEKISCLIIAFVLCFCLSGSIADATAMNEEYDSFCIQKEDGDIVSTEEELEVQKEAETTWEPKTVTVENQNLKQTQGILGTRYMVLLLDTSCESRFYVNDKLIYTADPAVDDTKKAAQKFINDLKKTDGTNYVAIIDCCENDETAEIVMPFSADLQEVSDAINSIVPKDAGINLAGGLKLADTLLREVTSEEVLSNVVLFTTGRTRTGEYTYEGKYGKSSPGSDWYNEDTGVCLYAYANAAYNAAEKLKEQATIYTVGLFQGLENMPSEGKDLVSFFKLVAKDLASSSECFFDVDDPNELEFTFGNIADTINENKVIRLSGSDRMETSRRVATELKEVLGKETFETIIIATSTKPYDALAGSYLAINKEAPILLTNSSSGANTALLNFVKQYAEKDAMIYIIGGTNAVSASVDTLFMKAGYDVVRLGGKDRYETNIMVLEKAGYDDQSDLLVVTSEEYADSLSVSATGKPILFVKSSRELDTDQKTVLKEFRDGKVYIIGGEKAIDAKCKTKIEAYLGKKTERIAGENRYLTSIKVAEKFFKGATQAVIATGADFPDGLCGGPLAAAQNAPLILTMNEKLEAAEYAGKTGITSGYVLGGTSAIANSTAKIIFYGKNFIK